MKFPRNAKIFRGHLDAAPFVTVFFLLVMFAMRGTLVPTPGVPIELQLPSGVEVAGTDKLSTSVAVDAHGRLYYGNQLIEMPELRKRLKEVRAKTTEPMALIIQADKNVSHDLLVRVALMARDVGFREARLAVLPRPGPGPRPVR
jgi:biopolymer transport protein ExbD